MRFVRYWPKKDKYGKIRQTINRLGKIGEALSEAIESPDRTSDIWTRRNNSRMGSYPIRCREIEENIFKVMIGGVLGSGVTTKYYRKTGR